MSTAPGLPAVFRKSLESLVGAVKYEPAAAAWLMSGLGAIAASDPGRKTRMEYSLHFRQGLLERSLRIVNYAAPCSPRAGAGYARRVELAERLGAARSGDHATLARLFAAVRRFEAYRLPVCLGLEAGPSGAGSLKVYVNFFGLNSADPALGLKVVKGFVKAVAPGLKIKDGNIPLFAVTLGDTAEDTLYKVYHAYDNGCPPAALGLPAKERGLLGWLSAGNKRSYFAVMSRYGADGSFLSRKFEIRPPGGAVFLKQLCELTGNAGAHGKAAEILKATKGRLEVAAVEQGRLALYATFPGYGEHDTTSLK